MALPESELLPGIVSDEGFGALRWHSEFTAWLLDMSDRGLTQLAQGKTVDSCVDFVMMMLPHVLCKILEKNLSHESEDEEKKKYDKYIARMRMNLTSVIHPDDSCGADSNRICHLLLNQPRIARDQYQSLDDELVSLDKLSNDSFPCLFRFEVASDDGIGMHSFTLFAADPEKIFFYQSFAGISTFPEWLESQRYTELSALSLEEFFAKLAELQSSDESLRVAAYQRLFRRECDSTIASKPPMQVSVYRSPAIDMMAARQRLSALQCDCERELTVHEGLADRGFLSYTSEIIWMKIARYGQYKALRGYQGREQELISIRRSCGFGEYPAVPVPLV